LSGATKPPAEMVLQIASLWSCEKPI